MMFCRTCRGENVQPFKSNTFIEEGLKQIKLETVKDHELSNANRAACTIRSNRNKPRQETPAERA